MNMISDLLQIVAPGELSMKKLLMIWFSAISFLHAQSSLALSPYNYSNHNVIDYSLNLNTAVSDSNNIIHHSVGNVFGQTFLGTITGIGFSFLPGLLLYMGAGADPVDFIGFGSMFLSAYVLGNAAGVYWIAKSENPELSYWGIAAFSALGAGGGALLAWALADNYHTFPGYGFVLVALCPVISSILYTTLIADWPQENLSSSSFKNQYTYKDFVAQAEVFKIELIRIKF
jgi:hypothetical protein